MLSIVKIVVEMVPDREFDYIVPQKLEGSVFLGSRVLVPFRKTETTGYVVGFADDTRVPNLKQIVSVLGKRPVFDDRLLRLARWIADYYCAPVEHALRAVLPSAIRKKGAGFKHQLYIALSSPADAKSALDQMRSRSPKQAEIIETLLNSGEMLLSDLKKRLGITDASFRALKKKGLVRIEPKGVDRDPWADQVILPTEPLKLMPEQETALLLIRQATDTLKPPVVLLHGVTGSGKTEVYLQAIDYVLKQGKGAIVLVPEISLTPQTIERFRSRFGDTVAVLHSHLSQGERHDEWHRLQEGLARIAIGARSAVFAPVTNLGLIVVDEEHEPSYKQEESPRYNARDVAVVRGSMEPCAVVLGSATPSFESYFNAKRGKYGLAVLSHRVDNKKMPVVQVVDMRIEAEHTGHVSVFSREMMEAIRIRRDRAEQTILFLNRRGYASSLICRKCGYVAMCDQCSIAMTYHRQKEELHCHICGEARKVPAKCPSCADPTFKFVGIGTQRIESIIGKLLPQARVQRMDTDTTTTKDAHRKILGDFRSGKIHILVGTQMVAKGLDFPNVTLIGVIYADLSLHIPDFRAGERTFQLLTQVAGRAGRGEIPGQVIIQTYTPHHPAVLAAQRMDYEGFYGQEMEFRRELNYPPFSHLACLTVKGTSEDKVLFFSKALAKRLTEVLSPRVILAGPAQAPIARAKGYYRQQIILRSPSARAITEPLKQVLRDFKWPEKMSCIMDMDALSLM